jgi:hypothetical protein
MEPRQNELFQTSSHYQGFDYSWGLRSTWLFVLSCGHQKEIVGISATSRQAIRVKKLILPFSSFSSEIIHVIHHLAT